MILDVIPEEYKKFMIEKIFSNPEIKDCLKENDVEGAIDIIKSFPNLYFKEIAFISSYQAEVMKYYPQDRTKYLCRCIKIKDEPIPYNKFQPASLPWEDYRIIGGGAGIGSCNTEIASREAKEVVIKLLQKMIEEAN